MADDPVVLRAQAAKLRKAAKDLRTQAGALDDDLVNLQKKYPLPSDTLWQGPHAKTYADALSSAKTTVGSVKTSIESYAGACDAEAVKRDKRADDAEKKPAG
ncbi:hypothetical protein [Kribbella alba]|uniref:hypothetical protein n=1 Tax=Kribbella alba TaxID=190197 RepID=UPI0031D1B38B